MTDVALILFGLMLGVYVGAYFASRGWRLRAIEDAQLITALRDNYSRLLLENTQLRHSAGVAAARKARDPDAEPADA